MSGSRPILVTGASGFVGRHLLPLLGAKGEILVAGRNRPPDWPVSSFFRVDLENADEVFEMVWATRPRQVFHLAGRTPPASTPAFYRANTLATVHLIEGLKAVGEPVRIVVAGSAAEIGPTDLLPIGEDRPCRPVGDYALSKWFATCSALDACPPLEVVVARLFNPIGPGAPETQALGRFARRLAIPSTEPLHLKVGSLDARRDFLDVRDAARALVELGEITAPAPLYHVGSGQSRPIRDGLDYLIRLADRPVRVEFLDGWKPSGPDDSRADISRLLADASWRPMISFETSLDDLWREVAGANRVPPPHFPGTEARSPRPTGLCSTADPE